MAAFPQGSLGSPRAAAERSSPYLGRLRPAARAQGAENLPGGPLGAKAGFSGTGGAVASRIGLKAGVRQVQGRAFQQGTDL